MAPSSSVAASTASKPAVYSIAKDRTATMTATPSIFSSALLLVDAENNAAVDRRALREVGITQLRVMTSGVQAAKLLAGRVEGEEKFDVDVVFCQPRLADMNAAQWVELIRSHPRLTGLPILAVVGNNSEAEQLKALAAGFSQLIVRPYSHQDLRQNLQNLQPGNEQELTAGRKDLDCGAFEAALRHFERCSSDEHSAEAHFELGLRCLSDKQWDAAILAFHKAIYRIALKGEAELGLAAAWRGKGDVVKYRQYLAEAGQTFARAARWSKARTAYARLLLVEPDAPSPFLHTAECHIRAGRYGAAVEALTAGYDMDKPQNRSDRLAKACLFTENPAFTLTKVQKALDNSPLGGLAPNLGPEIHHSMERMEQAAEEKKTELQRQKVEALEWASRQGLEADKDRGVGISLALLEEEKERGVGISLATPEEETKEQRPKAPVALSNIETRQLDKLPVLPSLREDDAESRMFTSFPGLNEAMTVIKVTLKLLKK